MKRNTPVTIGLATSVLMVVLAAAWPMEAQDRPATYPSMAPLNQYLMDRDAEIALARSAAPESISGQAEIQVLGPHGYELAVKGTNGFVCVVERGWMAPFDNADFWNPKLRGPLCFNPAAARSVFPLTIKRTNLVLAGMSKAQVMEALKTATSRKELPGLEGWRDELHDVEEGVPDGGRESQPVSPDDLRASGRCCVLGRG